MAPTHQGHAHLQTNRKPTRSTNTARSQKNEVTVRYFGVEVDDAHEMSEQTKV